MISLELVPHELEACLQESQIALKNYSQIGMINIPDVLRIDIRSWKMVQILLENGINAIPHMRTMDRTVEETIELLSPLVASGLKNILLVSGDIPEIEGFKPSHLSPIDYAAPLQKAFPSLKLYAGLDPYRSSIREELLYCQQKIDAGFAGFFTQPFFEKNLLRMYLEQFQETELFIGISPVTSPRSIKYWENVNNVVLPKDFDIALAAQAKITQDLLAVTEEYKQNAYLMPITISSQKYLEEVF